MKRFFRLGAPLATSVTLRLSQLVLMISAANSFPAAARPAVLATFGAAAAFGVFSDSGAATFLLTRSRITSGAVRVAMCVQLALSAVGVVATCGFALLAFTWEDPHVGLFVAGTLAVTQAADSLVRVARAVRLQAADDIGYASGDAVLATAKLLVALLVVTVSPWMMALLPVSSIGVAVWFYAYALRHTSSEATSSAHVSILSVLNYGLSGLVSGLYSQAPFLIAAATLPVESVAVLAVLLRVAQPLEIIPSVASQQIMPRIRTSALRATPTWLSFVLVGLSLGCAMWVGQSLIGTLFDQPLQPAVLVTLVALALPFKFGNYALAAFLLQGGAVNQKTLASLGAGVLAVLITAVGGGSLGASAAALAMICSEVALAGFQAALIFRRGHRSPSQLEDK